MAELVAGTLVFSAARTGNIVVAAHDAMIRPATDVSPIAHIRVVNRREVRIYAQRGALEFSYHDESETIPEGVAYRVLLDPSETDARVMPQSDQFGTKTAKHLRAPTAPRGHRTQAPASPDATRQVRS